MKNKIAILLLLVAVAVPQIASAAWWNPVSWFNNWNFRASDTKTQILENRVKELEQKLNDSNSKATTTQATTTTKIEKKEPVVKTNTSPAIKSPEAKPAAKVSTVVSNQQEVQDWANTLNLWITHYQGKVKVLEANSAFANDFKDKYVHKLDESSGSLVLSSSLNVIVTNQELLKGLNSRINELSNAITQINNTGSIDRSVWSDKKFADMQTFSNYVSSEEAAVTKKYKADLAMVLEYLNLTKVQTPDFQTIPQSSVATQFEAQSSEYNKQLADMKAKLVEEYKAAGGFWTASQLESNAMLKLKEMGIKPPTSPYGGLNTPNYSSTHCNSLNGGLDCTSSGGTRTYVVPTGNGSYNINSY